MWKRAKRTPRRKKQERVDLAVSRKDNSGKTTTFVIKANGEVVSE